MTEEYIVQTWIEDDGKELKHWTNISEWNFRKAFYHYIDKKRAKFLWRTPTDKEVKQFDITYKKNFQRIINY